MNYFYFPLTLCICIALSSVACADIRGDAMNLLVQLRREKCAQRLPDEMRSIDATLATAELYYQLYDSKNADRYYLMAIQKASLLQQKLQVLSASVPVSVPPDLKAENMSTVPIPAATGSVTNRISSSTASSINQAEQKQEITDKPQQTFLHSNRLTGSVSSYTVRKGESIRLIAAKLGVNRATLAAMNGLSTKAPLKAGLVLRYNNRRIIPEHTIKNGIVINIPDRMLYFFQRGNMIFSTAVALGIPTRTDQLVWETPTGKFTIVNKAKDPTWTVPPSIQEEMLLEGKEIITSIPPGKDNPLGKYALKTSLPGILIHSTTKPWSIYTYASHGCIRVYPERMEELFELVKVKAVGEIVYHPVKLAVTEEGRILLEAHGDIYKRTKGLTAVAKSLIRSRKLDDKVDWEKVNRVISRRTGVAEEVTLTSIEAQKSDNRDQTHSPS